MQDQSMAFGSDRSRFTEAGKRAVEDKNFGPLVKTVMTRCIHCTRCVRFANEVAGVDDLGTSGRGNDMQIGTYVEKMLDSELSANIVDLCPVGALTSKPYAFKARPWELKHTESTDVLDAVGSNIRIDSRGLEVMRVLPRLNEDINEEWLADKSRFACDGLTRQRLTQPMINENGNFRPVSWEKALKYGASLLKKTNPKDMVAIAGELADVEAMVALKDLFARLGCRNLTLDSTVYQPNVTTRNEYLFNSGIKNVEKADVILLVGTNPKMEAPLINSRIRKGYLYNESFIGLIGEQVKLNYEYEYLGARVSDLHDLTSKPFFKKLMEAKNPMIIVGSGVFDQENAGLVMDQVKYIASKFSDKIFRKDWNGLNVLQRASVHYTSSIIFYGNNICNSLLEELALWILVFILIQNFFLCRQS